MFNKKKTNFISEIKTENIDLNNLDKEINNLDNYIIYKIKNKFKIFDRNCDHAGGKILSMNGVHKCPYHNWRFNPKKGEYFNGIKKKELDYKIINNKLIINRKSNTPKINLENSSEVVKIKYFNHAFLTIKNNFFKFATDPWALGPAFGTGWWLSNSTTKNWIKEINECDFIYISHNHPDHMHALTLSLVRKNMLFLIPSFSTKSVFKCLKDLGFTNIFCADFLKEYSFKNSDLNLMILKSGDFRDDSGIYFSAGGTSFLLSVDSNNLNSLNLPKVDIYASSYAAGASGYPLIFENYKLNEKKWILNQNKNLLKSLRLKEIKISKAKYFLPYAGNFDELLLRDKYINKNNIKNKINDFKIIEKTGSKLLNIKKYNEFNFLSGKLILKKFNKEKKFQDLSPKSYYLKYKKNFSQIDHKYIKRYFTNSNFKDNLKLYVSLTNDDFTKAVKNFYVDFSYKKIVFRNLKRKIQKKELQSEYIINEKKILFIKARIDSFFDLIVNKNPWEDLSIGFQCRVFRIPNEYNANFWYHFSNIYIKSGKIRQSNKCKNCEVLNQNLQKELVLNGAI